MVGLGVINPRFISARKHIIGGLPPYVSTHSYRGGQSPAASIFFKRQHFYSVLQPIQSSGWLKRNGIEHPVTAKKLARTRSNRTLACVNVTTINRVLTNSSSYSASFYGRSLNKCARTLCRSFRHRDFSRYRVPNFSSKKGVHASSEVRMPWLIMVSRPSVLICFCWFMIQCWL